MSKTAMQELIDILDKINQDYYKEYKLAKGADRKKWDDAMSVQTLAVIQAKKLLILEKQQIMDAWEERNKVAIRSDGLSGEDYYNQTYQ